MNFLSKRSLSASTNIYIVAFVDAVEGLTAPRKQSTGFCHCISELNKSVTLLQTSTQTHHSCNCKISTKILKKKNHLLKTANHNGAQTRAQKRQCPILSQLSSNSKMTREQKSSESQPSNLILCNSGEELLRKPNHRNTQHKNLHVDEFRSFQLQQQALLFGQVSREKGYRILNQESALKCSDCNCSRKASLFTAFT